MGEVEYRMSYWAAVPLVLSSPGAVQVRVTDAALARAGKQISIASDVKIKAAPHPTAPRLSTIFSTTSPSVECFYLA
jgi:hypothetical protein